MRIEGDIISEKLANQIRQIIPSADIRVNEPMAAHTSFKIGGPASIMLFPTDTEELMRMSSALYRLGEKPLLLGNGSNVLAPDDGINRTVIVTTGVSGISVSKDDGIVIAECGVPLTRLAASAAVSSLAGIEFLYGIPGTVGGALVMNAGAYGGEMKDVVYETKFITGSGEVRSYKGCEHGFGYRMSAFSAEDAIIKTYIKLNPGSADDIKSKMETLLAKRKASQPLDMPSAGSAFKRPIGGYAAELIDKAGLKGFSVGGAKVSEKHAGFIINTGGAKSDDVLRLVQHIQKTVYDRFGIELQPEIKILE